jgi:hypothetical protein
VAWPHDKFGCYSVTSAYDLARTEAFVSNLARGQCVTSKRDKETKEAEVLVVDSGAE